MSHAENMACTANTSSDNTPQSKFEEISDENKKSYTCTWNFKDVFPSGYITEATIFEQRFTSNYLPPDLFIS